MAESDEDLEKKAQEMAEKALPATLPEAVRKAKLPAVKQKILERLMAQRGAAQPAPPPGAPGAPGAPPPPGGALAPTAGGAPPPAAVVPPPPPPEMEKIEILQLEGIESCGDEPWFASVDIRRKLRESVAEAHKEQKILVGAPLDECNRICPTDGRILGAGAVLRLGGAHLGGYGESDVAYAYRQLSRALHPDKNPDIPNASNAFHRLAEAADELRQGLIEQRNVLQRIVATLGGRTTPEMTERPQEALFAEATRMLTAVLFLCCEGDVAVSARNRNFGAFTGSNIFHSCQAQVLLSEWFERNDLLDLFAGASMRTAYDCAPKRFRAQFLGALNRATVAEAKRCSDCVRGNWGNIWQQFPELGLWRDLRERIQRRVWDTSGDPPEPPEPEPTKEKSRSKSRKRKKKREKSKDRKTSKSRSRSRRNVRKNRSRSPLGRGGRSASRGADRQQQQKSRRDRWQEAEQGNKDGEKETGSRRDDDRKRARPSSKWDTDSGGGAAVGNDRGSAGGADRKSKWDNGGEENKRETTRVGDTNRNSREVRGEGAGTTAVKSRKDKEWDERWVDHEARDDAKDRSRDRSKERAERDLRRTDRKLIEQGGARGGWNPCAWAKRWRRLMLNVLPSCESSGVPMTDPEVRRLSASLWFDIVDWAAGSEAERGLGLFRADTQGPGTFGWGSKAEGAYVPSRGLDPDSPPVDWSFVPAADLLLIVGEGILGLTSEGVSMEKEANRRRKTYAQAVEREEQKQKEKEQQQQLEAGKDEKRRRPDRFADGPPPGFDERPPSGFDEQQG